MDETITVESSIWGASSSFKCHQVEAEQSIKPLLAFDSVFGPCGLSVGLQGWTLSPIFQSALGPCLAHPHLLQGGLLGPMRS